MFRVVKYNFDGPIAGLICCCYEGLAIAAERETVGNQFIGKNQFSLYQLNSDLKSRCFLGCINRPGLHTMTLCTNEIDLLVPYGGEIDTHAVKIYAHHDHG